MNRRMVAPALIALALSAAAGSVEAQRPKPPKRMAVIVGIDNYANAATPLKGAVNDAKLTRSMLVARGYAPVLMLTDQEATAPRIRKALGALAKGAGPRDHVYIHFSGFGNKEAAGPALCTADYTSGNGISYKEVQGIFKSIRTPKKTAVIDCSFMAGKPTSTTVVRYWPGTRGTRALVGPSLNRPAVETLIKVGKDSKWQGALTWNFVRTMQTSAPKTTVKQLDGAMNARSAGKFAQKIRARDFAVLELAPISASVITEPQVGIAAVGDGTPVADQIAEVVPDAGQALETVAEKVDNIIESQPTPDAQEATFETIATGESTPGDAPGAENLGQQLEQGANADVNSSTGPPQGVTDNSGQAVSVESTQGQDVVLGDGASSDLTPGTTLVADANNDGKPEAVVQVEEVGVDTATGEVTQGTVGENTQLEVAQIAPSAADDRLSIEVASVGGADSASVAAALQSMSFVRVVAAGEAPERRLAVGAGGAGLQGKLLPVDVAPDASNIADGATGADGAALAEAVKPQLIADFLFKRMALLNNPMSKLAVTINVTGPNGSNAAEGVKLGDKVTFGVSVDKPAHVTLFSVGAGGSMTVLLPNDLFKEAQMAQPGTPYLVPHAGAPFSLTASKPAGKTMVIAIASTKPLDMSKLQAATIPNFGGLRSIQRPEVRGARLRDFVVQAVGGEAEADEWGSAFLIVPVNE